MTKLDDPELRVWYGAKAAPNGWSRDVLVYQIEARLLGRRSESALHVGVSAKGIVRYPRGGRSLSSDGAKLVDDVRAVYREGLGSSFASRRTAVIASCTASSAGLLEVGESLDGADGTSVVAPR
jgi:hypothetical protein